MTITYHNHKHNHRNTIAVCVYQCVYMYVNVIYTYICIYAYLFIWIPSGSSAEVSKSICTGLFVPMTFCTLILMPFRWAKPADPNTASGVSKQPASWELGSSKLIGTEQFLPSHTRFEAKSSSTPWNSKTDVLEVSLSKGHAQITC